MTEPGGFGAERHEMSLEWAGSRPQVQIPMGAGQEDGGGGGGMWPAGAPPPPGKLAATWAHRLDVARSLLYARAGIQIVV